MSALGIAAAGLGLVGAWPWLAAQISNGDASATTVALGKTLYAKHCATCHGANLEGQRDWKSPLASGRMPAPPHDESGHTWHHADGVLFRITKQGPAAVVGGGSFIHRAVNRRLQLRFPILVSLVEQGAGDVQLHLARYRLPGCYQ